MFQIRIHGRGGQGVVTAAELLSVAAFLEGKHAQAFPSFGSERTGAPVVAFCRIADVPIRTHEPITEPDALIVQDATLMHQVDVFDGLAANGYLLLNSPRSFEELGLGEYVRRFRADRLTTVPATQLAMAHLGRPVPNAVLLGGFAALSGLITLESVTKAIHERFAGPLAERNAAAAAEAFQLIHDLKSELAHVQAD
ncbi:2-oxoacid:acceptor oxidoreductase family protein [Flindersiella endophytica]